jgi:hypothetical protein
MQTDAGIVSERPPRFGPLAILLQIGHRVGAVAALTFAGSLVAILGANGALGPNITISKSTYGSLLMATFIAADVTLLIGFIVWWLERRQFCHKREAMGITIYGTVLMTICLGLFVGAKTSALDRFVQTQVQPLLAPQEARSFSY